MNTDEPAGSCIRIVTLDCKDADHAQRYLEVLASHGRPDALAFNCVSYEFGLRADSVETVYLVERWRHWQDLDTLLAEKVIPALPLYNPLLKQLFDPARDTPRINLP